MVLVTEKVENRLYFSILSGCDLQIFWFRCVMEICFKCWSVTVVKTRTSPWSKGQVSDGWLLGRELHRSLVQSEIWERKYFLFKLKCIINVAKLILGTKIALKCKWRCVLLCRYSLSPLRDPLQQPDGRLCFHSVK